MKGDLIEASGQHKAPLDLSYIHPTYLLWTYCLIGEIVRSMEQYEQSVSEEYRSFVDLGNVRAMSRAKLPMKLVG